MDIQSAAPVNDTTPYNEPQPEDQAGSALDEKMKEALDSPAGQTAKPELAQAMPQLHFRSQSSKIAQQLKSSVQIAGVASKTAVCKKMAFVQSPDKDYSARSAPADKLSRLKGEPAYPAQLLKTTADGAFMQITPPAAETGKSSFIADGQSRFTAINMATRHMSSAPATSAAGSDTQTLHYVFQHGEGKHAVNIQSTGTGEQRTLLLQPSSVLLGQQLRTEIALNPVEGHAVFKDAHEESQHKKEQHQRDDEETEA